jgi:hypothetical protein
VLYLAKVEWIQISGLESGTFSPYNVIWTLTMVVSRKDQKEKEANKPGHDDEERYQLEEEEQEEEKVMEEIDDTTTTTTRTMNHVSESLQD